MKVDPPEALNEAAQQDKDLAALDRLVTDVRRQDAAMSDIQLARVGQRLFGNRAKSKRPPLLAGLRLASVGAILLVGGAVGATATLVTLRMAVPQASTVEPVADVIVEPAKTRRARALAARLQPAAQEPEGVEEVPEALPVEEPAEIAPAPVPQVAPPQLNAPVRRRIRKAPVTMAPRALPAPTLSAEQSATTIELEELNDALKQIRSHNNPAAALLALNAYLERYPLGVFSDEARMARAEALAATGDREKAIKELSNLALRKPALRSRLQKLIDRL